MEKLLEGLPKPVRDNIMLVIPGALFLVMTLVLVIVLVINGARVSSARSSVVDIQGRLDMMRSEARRETEESVRSSAGVDADRVAEDDLILQDVLTDLFSWDDLATYEAKRSRIMRDYGLDASSMFSRSLAPDVVYVSGSDGSPVDIISEKGIKFEVAEIRSNVVNARSNRYDYLSEVDVKATDRDDREGVQTYVFTYGVTKEGTLCDLYAIRSEEANI